ncbi:citrate lyase subunit beta [Klebsiella pneumoniae]|nr:citrate lyase subunit beta [Klebsiella pneumoniae]
MEMKIDALAGTLESSDVMVRIGPAAQPGIQLEIDSIVKQQFGAAIEQVVRETLAQLGVKQANVVVDDKGAGMCFASSRTGRGAARGATDPITMEPAMKPRRSMLFIPGANAAMLSTSFVYGADAVMFDLEDAVSLREKDTARLLVYQALQHPLYQDIETVVRINPLNTPFGLADLEAVVRAGVDMVRLPKTDSKEDIHELEAHVERIERECGREVGSTKLMAAIESALGVVNAVEIARASPRLAAIALAAFDYVMDMGTSRGDGTELFYARCAVLHAARVAGIAAYDVVWSDINNEEGFLAEANLAKNLGFNGKSLVNPRQIELLHQVYAPTRKEVDHALEVIAAAEEAETRGLGVVSLNGKMIDGPIIDHARKVVALSASGIRD